MSKYTDQLEGMYPNIGSVKKKTKKYKELGLDKKQDIKKKIRKMLEN